LYALDIPTAEVFEPLLAPSRYKGAYGGRGSGKSHFFAETLIDDAVRAPSEIGEGLLSVCIREVQKSLKESAYRLITSKLRKLGLGERQGFKVYNDRIQTPKDGVIIFQGMQDHTAESIKSLEGFMRAWVEEAQTLSKTSLKLLRPTIRAPGSELWFSWNPRHKSDPVDQMFRQGEAPTGSVCVRANWSDNPWFPAELEQERQDCLRDDPDQYDNIWEGGYITVAEGAYYAKHIAKAKKEKRISADDYIVNVPEDPLMIVRLFADIGGTGAKSDNFVFWAAQFVGQQINWINHYEVQGQPIGHHLTWLAQEGYVPGRAKIWLPHDGETHDKVHAVSYESAFKKAGYDVVVVPNQGKGAASSRIEHMRNIFPRMWFDNKCQAGLEALGWYHEKKDDERQIGLGPNHDWASHSADAAGMGAIVWKPPTRTKRKKLSYDNRGIV
jgi:phage terminase large subunit